MKKLDQKTIVRLRKQYGNWVLITGATSGIGKQLALAFGKAGFQLVITGRREQQLNAISRDLFEQYQTEVVPITGDLSKESEVDALIRETAHLKIGIAVLNAGFGTSGKFIDADIHEELNMLDLNCKALLKLTHHFANRMKATANRGAIVLLSSMVAFQGVPNAAHYAATKAYVQSLGEALAIELKEEKVDILNVAPGPVATGFSERADMKMDMTLRPEDIALPMIKAIGRRSNILPGFLTKFLVYNLRMLPRWGKIRIMGKVMGGFTKHQYGG